MAASEAQSETGMFSRRLTPFGAVRRTLSIDHRSLIMLPMETWMEVGTTGDSLYWGVQTYCYSTMKAMNVTPASSRQALLSIWGNSRQALFST